ncbi:formimidoylglutamate deiminase [Caulobacter rhizosphaerae]|uniref:formimidoylglutamate deiminase n=1 Tax=Caulobacter rhizosphaerae TaxID=2010972 RepID=UPI0019892FDC|nr:formimidoylglutamate deiminase [Caulobacter rhizosphaerae]GGL08148.1 formimidoylglutamate deiminase [Caulobacter rhizosphaerae]
MTDDAFPPESEAGPEADPPIYTPPHEVEAAGEPERAQPTDPQTLWFEQALLTDGWARDVRFTIADGVIGRVDTGVARQAGEVAHGPCLPGLPNLHSHAFQRAMAGLTETRGPTGDSFWTWRELMYRFVDRLGPDEVQAIAALAYMEMLETGSTRVGEFHYLHHDKDGSPYGDLAEMAGRIAAAADETGIGLTLLPVFYAHAGFGGVAPGEGQRRFVHDVDGYGRLIEASRAAVAGLPDAVVGIAPHSLRAVTGEELTAILPLAGAGPIHIHIAEQTKEVDDCLAATGARPVRWLMNNAPVDKRWCLVHATHLNAMETERLAKSGAVAGLCPITEANLGDGVFPAHDYLAAGGAFGIGSDSNVLIDAAEELRTLEYGQRLTRRARNVLAKAPGGSTGGALFKAAVSGGAQALGVVGGLRRGRPADFVTLDRAHPAMIGRDGDALLDSLVFAGRHGAIDGVWRGGRQVVSSGRHDAREAILARYRAALGSVLA